jgi:hypothetical protein
MALAELESQFNEGQQVLEFVSRRDKGLRAAIRKSDPQRILAFKTGARMAVNRLRVLIRWGAYDATPFEQELRALDWHISQDWVPLRNGVVIERAAKLREAIRGFSGSFEYLSGMIWLETAMDILTMMVEVAEKAHLTVVEKAREGLIEYHAKCRAARARGGRSRTSSGRLSLRRRDTMGSRQGGGGA